MQHNCFLYMVHIQINTYNLLKILFYIYRNIRENAEGESESRPISKGGGKPAKKNQEA